MKTKMLRNGREVLAKESGNLLQYANRKQAENKVIEMQARGHNMEIVRGFHPSVGITRGFYVGYALNPQEVR